MKGHDIGVRGRSGRFEPWSQVDAAGFVINPTEVGIEYMKLVAKYVGIFALEEKSSWMLDQMSLFSTMEFFRRHYHIDVKLLEADMIGNQAVPYSVIRKTAGGEKFNQAKQVHGNWSDDQQVDNYTRLFHKYTNLYDSLSVICRFN